MEHYTPETDVETFKKSYIAGLGVNEPCNWKNVKFADKLKDVLCILLGCTREQLEDETFKTTPLGEEWKVYYSEDYNTRQVKLFSSKEERQTFFDRHSSYFIAMDYEYTPRSLLQKIGTNCLRNMIHPSIWEITTMREYNKDSKWIISDCRFPNELEAIKKRGGISIKINRNTGLIDIHESEISLEGYEFDYEIDNNSSFEDLFVQVFNILKKENLI